MSRIEDMIRDLCPDGVRWVKLGEVCEVLTGGEAPEGSIKGKEPQGDCIYPIYSNGVGDNSLWGYAPTYRVDRVSVTFSSIGTIGCPTIRDCCYTPIIRLKVLYPLDESILNVYYLKYALEIVEFGQQKSSVPNINANMIKAISFPLPPLPIQEKIVEILEKFSLLSAELEAELEGRRKQYDFYRNRLLSFDSGSDSVQWKALGDVGEFIKGSGILKSDFVEEGLPCIHYGQVHTRFNTFAYKNISSISEELYKKCKKAHTGDLIIASTSEDVEACCKAVAWLGDYDVAISGDAHIFRHNQNPKYIAYLFQTDMFLTQKRPCANGAKVVRVKSESMAKFKFPFPPLAEQERIVRILDKFEALVTDLSTGLPAEIERVQKQYEYYRNKLLTF